MPEISAEQWVLISRKLSSTPTSGHEYAFLRLLKRELETTGSNVTLVNSVKEISDDALPLLENGHPGFFGRRLRRRVRADTSRIFSSFGQNSEPSLVFHFYEGGFYEFNLLANLYLAFPYARFTFNFNLTDPWHVILRSPNNPLRRGLGAAIKTQVEKMSDRVFFTTETKELRQLFNVKLGIETNVYPLYSTVPRMPKVEKSIDFLAIVGSDAEAATATSILKNLRLADAGLKLVMSTRWGYKLSRTCEGEMRAKGISLKMGLLTPEEYADLLHRSKLAFLPYFDDYYKWSSSARLLDAVASDCHVIVPIDSTLSDLVEHNEWGFSVRQGDWKRVENIALSFTWRSLENPATTPGGAATFLLDCINTLALPKFRNYANPSFRAEPTLLSYLNLGLNPGLAAARYIDSRKSLARFSLSMRKFLAAFTAHSSSDR